MSEKSKRSKRQKVESSVPEKEIFVVGLSGKAGSGKNTSADAPIFSEYIQLAFADPIKKIAKKMFHLTNKQLYNTVAKEKISLGSDGKPLWHINGVPASPRLIFQWLGTKLRTEVAQDYFIKYMNAEIKKQANKKKYKNKKVVKFIITDVRFPNEAEFIKKLNGIVIKIERPGLITTTTLVNHESEKDLPVELIDHVVSNDGTVEDLNKKLSTILNPSVH